ncbi:class I SAM-dependent methyltransferase [Thiofilum flexile]|uniref:class I SAM-dependent methyltransferase n=1 Tax=Thiofilum flexile TaxID=125627 RepID=UPI000369F165|nr:class I SAM-dependent methyltransferase [Thiofilum flexile]
MNIFYQLKLLNNIGLVSYIKGIHETLYNKYIQKKFNIDGWHVTGYHLRPYKSQVVDLINNLKPNSILEVGCGLADILSKINCPNKIGIDSDPNVIKAANYIHRKQKINFITASLEESFEGIISSNIEKVDILLLVNWIHQIPFDVLYLHIYKLISYFEVKYIILDIIEPNAIGYRYHHSISQLEKMGSIVNRVQDIDKIRIFVVISPNK